MKTPQMLLGCALLAISASSSAWSAPGALLRAERATVGAAKTAPGYTSKSQGYALWLPGVPKPGTRKVDVPGEGEVTVRYVSVQASGVAYAVVPMAIPRSASANPQAVLGGIEEGFRASGGGKVVSSKSIKLGRYPGREAVITMAAGAKAPVVRGRFFVAPGRTFQVIAIMPTPPSAATKAQIQKVLDSFQILI